jgi:hypothetical protein
MGNLEYYGLLVTYNPYKQKWYAFSSSNEKHYWSGTCTELSEGGTAEQALNNYINK